MNEREMVINFLFQRNDEKDRTIQALQAELAALKKNQSAPQPVKVTVEQPQEQP